MTHELGDAPVEEQYALRMKTVARNIDIMFNGPGGAKDIGFILMVFPFGDHKGRCNYMSNASREDVIVLLKEQLARFQGMPEVKETRA